MDAFTKKEGLNSSKNLGLMLLGKDQKGVPGVYR